MAKKRNRAKTADAPRPEVATSLEPRAPGATAPWLAGTAAVVAAGAVLRILAMRGDLWLDEIWSLDWARRAGSFLGVFTNIHVDNNHYLNTLWLRALGDAAPIAAYRALALLAGLAALAVPYLLFRTEREPAASFAATALVAASPLLVVLSSEARGYAVAVLCALLSLHIFRGARITSRAGGLLFGAISALGFLGHLSFVHAWLGGLLATAVRARREPDRRFAAWLQWQALPLLTLALLALADLSKMRVAGGEPTARLDALARMASAEIGLPERSPFGLVAFLALAGLLAAGLASWRRRDPDGFAFLLVATAVSPALFVIASSGGLLYPRYFAVPLALALVVIGRLLADALARGGARRLAAAIALAAVSVLGVARTVSFVTGGARGRYSDALRVMADRTTGPIVVGSDFDFRNDTVLRFTAQRMGLSSRVVYVPENGWGLHLPEWFVVHSEDRNAEPPLEIPDGEGHIWKRVRDFRHGGISGLSWFLYRRAGAASG